MLACMPPRGLITGGGIMFSTCSFALSSDRSFVRPLPGLWTRYFENDWTDFDANWHHWFAGQGHETINFWVRRSKVKITRRRNRSPKSLSARYLTNKIFQQLIRRTLTKKCLKKLQFIHKLTASDTSKTAKITKKVILPTSTSPKCQCAAE